jgi:hypothetical protein
MAGTDPEAAAPISEYRVARGLGWRLCGATSCLAWKTGDFGMRKGLA